MSGIRSLEQPVFERREDKVQSSVQSAPSAHRSRARRGVGPLAQPAIAPRADSDRAPHLAVLDEMLAVVDDLPPGSVEDIPRGPERPSVFVRAFEILVASVGIVLTAPIMLAIAIVIKRGTPGAVLFRQERVGVNGKPFKFTKFRTLYADARERFPELYEYSYGEDEVKTMQFKTADDPRITPQGRWLRKSSLDELPNLFHVLTGKMALVGPRPQIPELLPYYKGPMLERFSVRPGLTDSAHVSGRSHLSFYETTAMDVHYVRTRSFWNDLKILTLTALAVLRRDGAF